MANIRVDLDYMLQDGAEIKFRSPVDCSQITGLIVYYPGADGNTVSKVFTLADAHGNNVGDIDHLFAEDVVVKVILDVTKGMAFVQNADTNAYLEAQLASKRPNTWMPTAEQVGARPNTWMPTAEQVGARPNTWMPSASDVGALPTSGGTMTGAINMNGKIIHGLPNVTGKDQPVTLNYLEPRYWNSGQVWNNAAGGSNFGSQKVSVDLSSYGAVLIFFKHAHENAFVSEFGIKNQKSVVTRGGFTAKDGKYYIATYRDFSVSDSGVTFSAGFASQNNTDATEQNWALVPFLILGLRGLS